MPFEISQKDLISPEERAAWQRAGEIDQAITIGINALRDAGDKASPEKRQELLYLLFRAAKESEKLRKHSDEHYRVKD